MSRQRDIECFRAAVPVVLRSGSGRWQSENGTEEVSGWCDSVCPNGDNCMYRPEGKGKGLVLVRMGWGRKRWGRQRRREEGIVNCERYMGTELESRG